MRDIKKRYFLTPPLTDADYIRIGKREERRVRRGGAFLKL
jgi:hypothetical protein